ncbi:hypothetical protein GCM10028819_37360 [Spirosoma humi]
MFLAGTAEELFHLNTSPAPSMGDELLLDDEPYIITARRFVLEGTQCDAKNVDYVILYVRKTW